MADIDRTDAESLLQEQDISTILQDAVRFSAALRAFRTSRMSAKLQRMPVLSALPTAGFVGESATDPTGIKPTTEVKWADLTITAEEIACIVPIHENILDDSDYDLWGEVRPLIAQEFGRVLDSAVFFGVNKPASWPAAIVLGAARPVTCILRQPPGTLPRTLTRYGVWLRPTVSTLIATSPPGLCAPSCVGFGTRQASRST